MENKTKLNFLTTVKIMSPYLEESKLLHRTVRFPQIPGPEQLSLNNKSRQGQAALLLLDSPPPLAIY